VTEEERNVGLLMPRYEAWAASRGTSVEFWAEIFADEVQLRSLGAGRPGLEFARSRHGRDEMAGFLRELNVHSALEMFEVEEYVADGDRVVMIGRMAWRNRATGKLLESLKVDLWRFVDGQAVEFLEMYDTAAAVAAATPA
jgi:hypothetical protein